MKHRQFASALIGVALVAMLALGTTSANDNANAPTDEGGAAAGGGWNAFSFGGVGSTVSIGAVDVLTEVRVADGYCYGDRFMVVADGVEQGETSEPGSTNCGGPSGQAAYDDPDMSSGCFLLPAGATDVTIVVTASPFGAGGGHWRADPVLTQADSPCLGL